jgi:hypothetical protein
MWRVAYPLREGFCWWRAGPSHRATTTTTSSNKVHLAFLRAESDAEYRRVMAGGDKLRTKPKATQSAWADLISAKAR